MLNSKKKWIYAGLSGWLVFHLFCIVLAPNSNSYLGQVSMPIVSPYINFFELASQWGFFAPDPGPPPLFIEYELVGQDGNGYLTSTFPEHDPKYALREPQNRRVAMARFLLRAPENLKKIMGAYFCRQNKDATAVRFWRVVESIPGLSDVAAGKRRIGDGAGTERSWVGQYVCAGGAR